MHRHDVSDVSFFNTVLLNAGAVDSLSDDVASELAIIKKIH